MEQNGGDIRTFSELWERGKHEVSTSWDSACSWFRGHWDSFAEWFSTSWSECYEVVSLQASSLLTEFLTSAIGQQITDGATNLSGLVTNWSSEIIGGLVFSATTLMFKVVKNTFKNLCKKIASSTRAAGSWLKPKFSSFVTSSYDYTKRLTAWLFGHCKAMILALLKALVSIFTPDPTPPSSTPPQPSKRMRINDYDYRFSIQSNIGKKIQFNNICYA